MCESRSHSQTGINELSAIMGGDHGFDTVKPLKLFKKIIQLWCPPQGIVLDPFAGSGTSGHAVLDLNAESGSRRSFVLIEQGRPDRAYDSPHFSQTTPNVSANTGTSASIAANFSTSGSSLSSGMLGINS